MPSLEGGGQLQRRDLEIIWRLFNCRFATLNHLAALYFTGSYEAAKKRIYILSQAGHIRSLPHRHNGVILFILAKRGFDVLREKGQLENYPSIDWRTLERRREITAAFIQHDVEAMDATVSLVLALRQLPNASTIEFSTWPFLNQFSVDYHIGYGRKEAMVKPDGFIHLRASKPNGLEDQTFFLELDRSTESLSILADKAMHYRAYYRSGGFAERSGDHPDAYRDHPFRVLMVCKSEARQDNAARRLLSINPPIKTMVWLTTLREIVQNPLGPIWVRPVEYRNRAGRVDGFSG
jgi:Replication-relaxation